MQIKRSVGNKSRNRFISHTFITSKLLESKCEYNKELLNYSMNYKLLFSLEKELYKQSNTFFLSLYSHS